MSVTRRGFLGLLSAAIATPALPAYSVDRQKRIVIRNKKIILDHPLIIDGVDDFLIEGCHISASTSFEGSHLIKIDNSTGSFIDITVDMTNVWNQPHWGAEHCVLITYHPRTT